MTDPFIRDGKLWDAIYGCWMGKNCGGTLGAPLEKGFGEAEPFDVWWYPKLQEGGIPNDDLEMQLLWLKALEEVGPQLNAQHLAEYWLDHIGYNWDEYGFSKGNMIRGLRPPVSGSYNNWFKDCMGCPIRTEIWACIAPGHPKIAAKYAYEDAIVDHAGGESVHGELFNVAIEAAAFVVQDKHMLLDIGMSYVGPETQTALAINTALKAYKDGVEDWKEVRRRVLKATPHHNAQYSPINMAFQVIGWLWGDEFGDQICKAVNCGYDTDCTGATLGSFLGIILGRHGLPKKWVEPLGEPIATNESWGGLRHASAEPNPIPANLTDLTDRTVAMAKKVLAYHGIHGDPLANVREEDLYADDSIKQMVAQNPMAIINELGAIRVDLDYIDTPAVIPGTTKKLRTRLISTRPDPMPITATLNGVTQKIELPPRSEATLDWSIPIGKGKQPQIARYDVVVHAKDRPAMAGVPVVLIGATKLRYCGPFDLPAADDQASLDTALPPEQSEGKSRPGEWIEAYAPDNVLPIANLYNRPGVMYVQSFVFSERAFEGRVAVGVNGPAKVWFNGEAVAQACRYRPIRPTHEAGGDGKPLPTQKVNFKEGWNEILVKFVRNAEAARQPFEAHLVLTEGPRMRGLTDYTRTHFPWE